MSKKMKIIPVFVPHIGCPNDCVFCNQRRITGKDNVIVNSTYVKNIIEEYRKTIDENTYTELAFFGGSFTAIDLSLQEELLKVGKYYKDSGVVHKIRCSTRPDAINDEILYLHKKYGMNIIELGIQSLDNEVLNLSNRGHSKNDAKNASLLIRKHNFILGHQIMPGLPGSTKENDIQTCKESIAMEPEIVRIYPTLIIKDTALVDMYDKGIYNPLTLEEAIDISAKIYSLYKVKNINVIRIGLQNTESINSNEDVVAGPFHPAFRQLVEEKIYLSSLIKILSDTEINNHSIQIYANKKTINYIIGHKKSNFINIKKMFGINKISFKETNNENLIEIYNEYNKIGSFENSQIYKNYLR
ncbi:elongator complex protein 3 [Sedimentibacter sp. MB31-C6]|uniref:elongator complex protein 3 n=1 Tax=Sedimentibacter sp. MB31-C6 TaxID=3109366 RepID=UPI002DDCD2C1|nr:radical SAM protein [Sedimentibacter sp. MB36-C1]WSI04138.1 radical SAM protein [Sedimentibacter sp. MB36-C1]